MKTTSQYAPLLLIGSDRSRDAAHPLVRLPLRPDANGEGYNEAFIQQLFFDHPTALPVSEIDSAFTDLIPVCMELNTPAGYIDGVYVNAKGMLTLTEFKLWRNPAARREVVGQILDYAKELARWDYSDLQREISRCLKQSGDVLFDIVHDRVPELDQSTFVDDVSRNLRKGRFLLLIVGDGIREGVESIVDYIQQHTGLQFTMSLIEAAIYRLPSGELIVQPRTLARSVIVNRTVVELRDDGLIARNEAEIAQETELSENEETNLNFWTTVLSGLSLDDKNQKVPTPNSRSNAFIMFGFTGEIWITLFISRGDKTYGVFVSRSTGSTFGEEAFSQLENDFDQIREESGEPVSKWTNSGGRPRIGVSHPAEFLTDPSKIEPCVEWLQQATNGLVNAVRPRVERLFHRRD